MKLTDKKIHIVTKLDGEDDLGQYIAKLITARAPNVVSEKDVDNSTTIIAIGGDGTVIHASKLAAERGAIVAGINVGHLGFLPDFEPDYDDVVRLLSFINEYEEALVWGEAYKLGEKYSVDIEPRYLLGLTDDRKPDNIRTAMNEFYVHCNHNKVLKCEVYINDKLAFPFIGDGLIFSTPTGSTAYSLSAGGAIVDPTEKLIQITPVAAHMLTSRPVIVGSGAAINIRFSDDCKAIIRADGQQLVPRRSINGGEINISYGGAPRVSLIRNRAENNTIFDVLKDKLYFSARNG